MFLQEGFAYGFVGEMALAFEAASGDAGKGVEHAKVVQGIGNEGFAENFCADIGDDSANLRGSELLGGLEAADALLFAHEVEGEFLAQTTLLEETLLAEIILVSARFPTPDVFGVKTLTGSAELPDELGKGEPVVEQVVYFVAHWLGEAGDSAGAMAWGDGGDWISVGVERSHGVGGAFWRTVFAGRGIWGQL